jgi:biopolymer transport protein ExbD
MAAEIEAKDSGKKGKKRGKKLSTRIDMTPLVDLGFLLVTFFILTSSYSKPQAMDLRMPEKNKDNPEEKQDVKQSEAMTAILGANDKVYYWYGLDQDGFKTTDFSNEGIGSILKQRRADIGEKLTVVIKSGRDAKYKNMVDLLDEVGISDIKRFAIVDFESADQAWFDSKGLK